MVGGYSAGGIATRLALANMEAKYKQGLGPHPNTKLWVSIETENLGANVPLGLQYLFNYQRDPLKLAVTANPGQRNSDIVNQLIAEISYRFNNNPTANQLTLFMASEKGGTHNDRKQLLKDFASVPLNSMKGYPEFCRRVGVSQGSSFGVKTPHKFDYIFDSKLQFGLGNSTAVSHPNTCGGSYTWYLPSTEKRTTAKWWSSINRSSTIFTGYNILSGKTTVFPMVCVKIPFIGCQCSGPYTIGGTVLLSTETKSKPASAINYDDVPGSSLSAHLEYYNTSAYPFYNNSLAGSAFAKNDPSLHAFAPTMSSLDIRNPTTGQPVSDFSRLDNEQGGLNLLNKSYDIKTNKLIQHAEKRYGFPHLSYPTNHYKVTPYDAVYAIGTDNGTYSDGITPKPNNQLHVEDPQTMMGEYLANVEVAPINLFLSNLTVGASASTFAGYNGGYTAEFEARDKIIVGKTDNIGNNIYSLYNNLNYLTPNGDFKVAIKSKAILHSGDFVEFLPGTEIPIGAELEAYILPYSCKNFLAKINKNQNNNNADDEPTATYNLPDKGFDYEKPINKTDKPITSFLLYPNPNNGSFVYVNVCEEQTSLLTIYNISGIVVYSQ
ncbi:MAG: T9SS type A sorting domain-containing protein [Bacteroidota bacterium]